jgi:hypothetical protein
MPLDGPVSVSLVGLIVHGSHLANSNNLYKIASTIALGVIDMCTSSC